MSGVQFFCGGRRNRFGDRGETMPSLRNWLSKLEGGVASTRKLVSTTGGGVRGGIGLGESGGDSGTAAGAAGLELATGCAIGIGGGAVPPRAGLTPRSGAERN